MTIINEFKATLISIVIFLNSSKAIFSFTHGLRLPYEAGFFLYHLHKPCFTDTHLIQTPHYYEALPGGGGSQVARLNFKTSRVSVYKCLSLIVSFAVTVTIWWREVVSCRNFPFLRCRYFLGHVACWNLPWQCLYYGQFALSLGKESSHIFSKFNPFNMDTFCGPLCVHINRV